MNLKTFALCLVFCFLYANFAFALDKSRDCKCRTAAAKRIVNGELSGYIRLD